MQPATLIATLDLTWEERGPHQGAWMLSAMRSFACVNGALT